MPDAKKTMLAAVHATEEWLVHLSRPIDMIQISANVAFSYTKREVFTL